MGQRFGRTPLLLNWNTGNGYNSGYFSAGAAFRERAATLFLQERGIDWTVLPCEGILLKSYSQRQEDLCSSEQVRLGMVLPIDIRYHALSVKPAGFARFSNFIWLMNRFAPDRTVNELVFLLARFLNPDRNGAADYPPSPKELMNSLAEAFGRGVKIHQTLFENGVTFGGVENNSATDGRIVDLENPHISGRPHLGSLSYISDNPERPIGIDSLSHFIAFSDFLWLLRKGFALLSEAETLLTPGARVYAHEMSRLLGNEGRKWDLPLGPGQTLRESWIKWFTPLALKGLQISRQNKSALRCWLEAAAFQYNKIPLDDYMAQLTRSVPMQRVSSISPRRHPKIDQSLWIPRFCDGKEMVTKDALLFYDKQETFYFDKAGNPVLLLEKLTPSVELISRCPNSSIGFSSPRYSNSTMAKSRVAKIGEIPNEVLAPNRREHKFLTK
jgi:hypothetical protein